MRYRVCQARSAGKLEAQVNDLIREGWRPVGGVCVIQSQGWATWWFYQPMITSSAKPEKDDDIWGDG